MEPIDRDVVPEMVNPLEDGVHPEQERKRHKSKPTVASETLRYENADRIYPDPDRLE